jgi:transposase
VRRFSPRQTCWILLRPVDTLDANELAYRQALYQESPAIATAQALVEDFGQIVKAQADTELYALFGTAAQSCVAELASFAHGLRGDDAAVVAALCSLYSQGQTEGHVNRLKMLKRQTCGRANVALLRCRALYHPASC